MIFTFTNADYGKDKIFHGLDKYSINIEEWQSVIPGPYFEAAVLFDDKLKDLFFPDNLYKSISYIGTKYLYNNIQTLRLSLGKLATTVGFLQKDFQNISNIFIDPPGDIILQAINVTTAIINSEAFQAGLNAIGAIPIVGWIIKIIVKIAEAVYKLVDLWLKGKVAATDELLRTQSSIPLVDFNKDADEELTKYLMTRIQNFDMEYAFIPRNYFEDLADFEVVREKKTKNQRVTDFFNIRSGNSLSGAGFIPGTTYLTSHIRLPTMFGGSGLSWKATAIGNVFDSGDFFPTVRNLCNELYQIVQAIGPSLYTVRPDYLSNIWENNIQSLLEYCEDSLSIGWSAVSTGCSPEVDECFGDKPYYICSEEIRNGFPGSNSYCGGKKDDGNKVYNIPKTYNPKKTTTVSGNHFSAFRQYLADLYFDGSFKDKSGKVLSRDCDIKKIDISKAAPIKALKVLSDRQKATINSINCAYISDDVVNGRPRFAGLTGSIKNKWNENLNLILQSQEWKKLNWRDIVDKEFKNEVAEKAEDANLTYNKEGPIVKPTLDKMAVPSVLGNPKVPEPFKPVGRVGRTASQEGKGTSVNSNNTGFLPLGIGVAALGYFWFNR